MLTAILEKMIVFYDGSLHDIEHFLKVHAYAAQIGRMEGLDARTQQTLEIAAIVHDIACPLCRVKYGRAEGWRQEEESEALLRPFLAEFALEEDVLERVIALVSHHHTTSDVLGVDHRILLEADFLVNASEQKASREAIDHFRSCVAETASGRRLLDLVYGLQRPQA